MSKKQSRPQRNDQESPGNDQAPNQSNDPHDRAQINADGERDRSTQVGGEEESKHGRKQKGNVNDT